MGLYNYNQKNLPNPLNRKKCLLCNNSIIPYNSIPELDAFQFKCSNCNPKTVINISGSMLASSLYDKLLINDKAKKILIRRIKNCKKKNYEINTIKISKILK